MQEKELLDLLEESKEWNNPHGITGLLLYVRGQIASYPQGRFIQALEGTEVEVRNVFAKIQHDCRHRDIILLNEGPIPKRNFETWLMGFKSINTKTYKNQPGYFELNDKFLRSGQLQKLNIPLTYLKNFYKMSLSSA